jgi:hypothetical protein
MTARYDVDRQVASWLASERPPAPPEGLLEAVAQGVEATTRRPGWQIADRWAWRRSAQLIVAARTVVFVAIIAALLVVAAGLIVLVGSPRPAPPFGLTRAGLIAFDTADGIVVRVPMARIAT